ncbi:hypothetical protein Q2E61_09300 [Microbulbifer thermotolerans]|uniref:hypothetical protein n=1 Tax=Microbulbifer thermotolerans TaxID=252514 RepID=UPI002672A25F|nr:hypothetical protein [Microbulbifer thermotolerans]WKT59123.1 hypothetical protein Q2E61_09300 [Microbulbifer thermotolerans]
MSAMDWIFVSVAAACVLLARGWPVFLWLVLMEFVVAALWIVLPIPDPWWFLAYAAQNCAFVCAVMTANHGLSREYAITLILSAVISVCVFCEYFVDSSLIYGIRPALMAAICTYQLWLAAVGAGLADGTLLEAIRGVCARGNGRIGRSGGHYSPDNMGRGA